MILFTGGSGRIGSLLKPLFPDAVFPARRELDITEPYLVQRWFPSVIVHLAALVGEEKCRDRYQAWRTNVIGTHKLALTTIPILYASTSYVLRLLW